MTKKQNGFTLVELMIAMAIAGILTSVAYPSYVTYVQKAKRSEAQAALVSMATAMEQWRVENNNNYGDGTDSIFATQVPTDGAGTKTYSLTFTTTVSASDPTKYDKYTLTATPVTPQDADICGVLTLKSTGEKGANNVSPDTAGCW
ncbi:MAG: type IV pilin protein [Methylococcaceae bacterium]